MNGLFTSLDLNKVGSFDISWKDDKLVFERFNSFSEMCYKFINRCVKFKVAL
jgi:hypothetical protein